MLGPRRRGPSFRRVRRGAALSDPTTPGPAHHFLHRPHLLRRLHGNDTRPRLHGYQPRPAAQRVQSMNTNKNGDYPLFFIDFLLSSEKNRRMSLTTATSFFTILAHKSSSRMHTLFTLFHVTFPCAVSFQDENPRQEGNNNLYMYKPQHYSPATGKYQTLEANMN